MALEFRGVSKEFESRTGGMMTAVDSVSFRVDEGEFVSVVGPSGCGKSTILSMTAGLYQPTVGDVLVSGEKVTGPNQHVGFMLQKDLLLPWRSIVHNIEFGLESRGVAREERRAIAMKELKHCHLDGFEGHYPYQLSGGMRQRAALARTLAIDPEIILLDEPFSRARCADQDAAAEQLRGDDFGKPEDHSSDYPRPCRGRPDVRPDPGPVGASRTRDRGYQGRSATP
jgi:NitT/TauT family transport system ATP-binding protein